MAQWIKALTAEAEDQESPQNLHGRKTIGSQMFSDPYTDVAALSRAHTPRDK